MAGTAHARYENARNMACQKAQHLLNGAHAVYLDEPLELASRGFAE